ncbi:hypothetical protein KCU61_g723, partial [Aureobasidium melanogenum]
MFTLRLVADRRRYTPGTPDSHQPPTDRARAPRSRFEVLPSSDTSSHNKAARGRILASKRSDGVTLGITSLGNSSSDIRGDLCFTGSCKSLKKKNPRREPLLLTTRCLMDNSTRLDGRLASGQRFSRPESEVSLRGPASARHSCGPLIKEHAVNFFHTATTELACNAGFKATRS